MKAQDNGERDSWGQHCATALTLKSRSEASREQDEFVALLTQELRSNLQAMLGFTQLMQRDQKAPLPERQGERVRRILASGDLLLRVLDDAGALSRIQSGQIPMVTQAVDVLRVLHRVRVALEPAAVSRRIDLAVGSSSVPRPYVAADPWGFTEVVLKLATNAIAYNKRNGNVTLQVSPIASARLRISVIDTGIGIPPEEQHKLFRPFPHVARTSPSSEGAGLGLATCRRLAASMNGSIGCRSVPDQGSEFWIDLPGHSGEAVAVIPGA